MEYLVVFFLLSIATAGFAVGLPIQLVIDLYSGHNAQAAAIPSYSVYGAFALQIYVIWIYKILRRMDEATALFHMRRTTWLFLVTFAYLLGLVGTVLVLAES